MSQARKDASPNLVLVVQPYVWIERNKWHWPDLTCIRQHSTLSRSYMMHRGGRGLEICNSMSLRCCYSTVHYV